MYQRILICFCSCLLIGTLAAQDTDFSRQIDSLERILPDMGENRERLQTMLALGRVYARMAPQKTVEIADEAITLATKLDADTLLIRAYQQKIAGYLYTNHQDTLDFDHLLARSSALLSEYKLPSLQSQNSIFKAAIMSDRGRIDSAYYWYKRAADEAQIAGNKRTEFLALSNLAILMGERGEIYAEEDVLSLADRAMQLAEETDCQMCISVVSNTLGEFYNDQENYKLALQHFLRSKEIKEKVGDRVGVITATCNLCETYYSLGDTAKARQLVAEGIRLAEEAKIWDRFLPCLVGLAKLEYTSENYREAIAVGKKVLANMRRMSYALVLQNEMYELLANSYEKLGEYKLAYEAFQAYKATSDSIQFSRTQSNLEAMQVEFNADKLSFDNRILEKSLENQRLITYLGILAIALLGFAAFGFYSRFRSQRQSREELEQLVNERTRELQLANEQLEQTNAELESFVYVASHDFKEPLRNISSFLGLIQRRLPDSTLDEHEESFGFINSAVQQLRTLVQDIKVFTKVRSMSADPEPVKLATVVQEVWEQVSPTFPDKKVNLEYEARKLPTFPGYRSQVYIVMKNLLENALKYSTSPEISIKIWSYTQNAQYKIFVQDDGIGIPEAYHGYVFQMFKRLHNREQYKGSGMGLAICARVLKAVGGKIWIESSEEGKGTTFGFSVPKQPEFTYTSAAYTSSS